jgi:ABC-type amino acid transport substrate-binding protein
LQVAGRIGIAGIILALGKAGAVEHQKPYCQQHTKQQQKRNIDTYTCRKSSTAVLFGKQMGYAFEIEVVPFESIIAGISSGKYDMGASSLNITAEREESVDFSDPYATFDVVLVVRSDAEKQSKMTLADIENAGVNEIWEYLATALPAGLRPIEPMSPPRAVNALPIAIVLAVPS